MLNLFWCIMVIAAVAAGAVSGDGAASALAEGAGEAVALVIALAGAMMFFMGLMEAYREAGLMDRLSRALEPAARRLFPKNAVTPVTLNLAANFFGLGSAATPFGIEAVRELERANPNPGVATDAMCLFLVMNSTAIEILPTNVIALRTAMGASAPAAVILPTFLSSLVSFILAVAATRLIARMAARRA